MTKIKTLTIQFNTPLQRRELPLFRGAIIASISTGNILFHNHNEGSTLRYAYPLIQYKRIGGKASIVCIEEGVEAIGELLANQDLCVNIGKRKIELRIKHVEAEEVEIENSETRIDYHLRDWLALNEINYALFFETDDNKVYAHSYDNFYEVKYKLYELESIIPFYYCRVSKSAIINLRAIYSLEKSFSGASTASFS